MRRTSSRRSISLHPGQNGRCTIIVQNSEVRMSRFLDTSTKTNTHGLNHGPVWKIQSFFLIELCTVTLEQDYYGKDNSRKFHQNTVGKKFQIGNVCSLTEKEDHSCLCMWTLYIKLAGKKQNIDRMWKILMKDADSGEPTSSLDHVYLGCTQRECQTSKDILENHRSMFESKVSAGAFEKLTCSGKLDANLSSWSHDMEGHAKKCVERYCELTNQTTQQVYQSRNTMY